jgi:hypothetical protein
MTPLSIRTFLAMSALGIVGATGACGSDVVPATNFPSGDDDAGGSGSGGSGSGSSGDDTTGSSSGGSSTSSSSSSSSSSGSGSSSGGSDAGPSGPCDMTGYWAAYQHSVAFADNVKETAILYLYYDLTQTGTTVTVNHGLHCGLSVVVPQGSLGDSVTLPSAGPALLARQDEGQKYGTHAARTGTMTPTSNACTFHLNQYYIVRGATLSYFMDPTKAMSANLPVASGCGSNFSNCTTPGSEDWDNDGFAGITLAVNGIASGDIYAAQRDFNEFYGTVPQNATKFEVGIVDPSGKVAVGPEQYALQPMPYNSMCSALCTLGSTVDQCPSNTCTSVVSEFFVDFVKLDSPPGSTNTDICKNVVSNASSRAPRAVDPNPAPTEAKYQ